MLILSDVFELREELFRLVLRFRVCVLVTSLVDSVCVQVRGNYAGGDLDMVPFGMVYSRLFVRRDSKQGISCLSCGGSPAKAAKSGLVCMKRVVDGVMVTVIEIWTVREYVGGRRGRIAL